MQKIMLKPAMMPSSERPTKSLKQRVKKAAAVVLPPVMMATPVCWRAVGDGLVDGPPVAEFLLVAAENLDAEIDADAEDHRDDRDGKNIEVADGDQGEAERPEHGHDQHEKRESRAKKGAVAEEEEADDQRQGDAAGLDVSEFASAIWSVSSAGSPVSSMVAPGYLASISLRCCADFFGGVAEGRVGILLFLAGVGEDQDGIAALKAEVFVLGEHLVGVEVVEGVVVRRRVRYLPGRGFASACAATLLRMETNWSTKGLKSVQFSFLRRYLSSNFWLASLRIELRSRAICSELLRLTFFVAVSTCDLELVGDFLQFIRCRG